MIQVAEIQHIPMMFIDIDASSRKLLRQRNDPSKVFSASDRVVVFHCHTAE
jgi:hypothetical protein